MASPIQEWEDAFGNQVSLGTTNEADIPGHYPFSPERWRLYENGNRVFVQYGDDGPEYTDIVDGHELRPQNAGDVLKLTSAEKFRYVVQYVIEWSGALQTNQALQSGDAVVFGYGEPDLENSTDDFPGPNADGWFYHWHSGLGENEVRIAEYRAGDAKSEKVVDTTKELTTWTRYAATTNWYNVGETEFSETYTEEVGDDQRNPKIGKTSAPNSKGPETANKPITLSVKAGDGAGSLVAELGSIGLRTLGEVEGIVRSKAAQIEGETVGATGAYVPVAALRVDPTREIVTADLSVLQPTDFGGSGNVKLIALAVDESKTDASGFTTPPEHSESNSVVEQTTSVTELPDSTGAQTTNPTNPGGYQLGFGSIQAAQGSSKTETSQGRIKKRLIANRDVLVITAFIPSDGATGDLTFEYVVEEDW